MEKYVRILESGRVVWEQFAERGSPPIFLASLQSFKGDVLRDKLCLAGHRRISGVTQEGVHTGDFVLFSVAAKLK